jgi:choline dehydrogenase
VSGVRTAREILLGGRIRRIPRPRVYAGSGVRTDEAIAEHVRETAETIYHPVGTCRMGDGEEAVVDDRLRAHGVEDLRVVDASVMPAITRGNTSAPTIAIAERAADLVT